MADDATRGTWGLAVVDGDLVLEDGGAGGARLRAVSGRDNLLQALERRVLTPAGSDRFDTRYGVDYAQVFGTGAGLRSARDVLSLQLVRALVTDPRVHDVLEIRFDGSGGGRGLAVEVVIQDVATEELALRLALGGA
jgi:hypothetical protein